MATTPLRLERSLELPSVTTTATRVNRKLLGNLSPTGLRLSSLTSLFLSLSRPPWLVCSLKALWGCLLQGRKPSAKEIADCSEAFRDAVKGQGSDFDRSGRHLQRVLVLGHPSDMLLYSALKALKAIGRWAHYLTGIGRQASRDKWFASPVVDTLTKVLSQWHWRPRRGTWGVWQSPEGSWDVFSPKKAQDKGAHALRQSWRLSQVLSWLPRQETTRFWLDLNR